jgi:hypothetical protein
MRTREQVEADIRILTKRIGRQTMNFPPDWVFDALDRARAELDAITKKENEG